MAAEVSQETIDNHQLVPMLDQVEKHLGRKAQAVGADAGYQSEAKATDEIVADIRRFSLRGLENIRCEWKLVCAASTLRKLFGSEWTPQAA